MRYVIMVLLAALLVSCATVPNKLSLTNDDDVAYVRLIWQESNPAYYSDLDSADLAWRRAQVFVARFGTSIRRSYDYCIDTAAPTYGDMPGIIPLSFTVTRLKEQDKVEICVNCTAAGFTDADRLAAKALLHYMRTGQLRAHLIGKDYEISALIREAQATQ